MKTKKTLKPKYKLSGGDSPPIPSVTLLHLALGSVTIANKFQYSRADRIASDIFRVKLKEQEYFVKKTPHRFFLMYAVTRRTGAASHSAKVLRSLVTSSRRRRSTSAAQTTAPDVIAFIKATTKLCACL